MGRADFEPRGFLGLPPFQSNQMILTIGQIRILLVYG